MTGTTYLARRSSGCDLHTYHCDSSRPRPLWLALSAASLIVPDVLQRRAGNEQTRRTCPNAEGMTGVAVAGNHAETVHL